MNNFQDNIINRVDVDVPSWDDYFMGLAFLVAERSKDAQTHHGSVLVDSHNRIRATGYNSFPAQVKDEKFPNCRPKSGEEKDFFKNKYLFMIHSEVNCLLNASTYDIRSDYATMFVSGPSCFSCLQTVYNAGVSQIIYADTVGWKFDEEEQKRKEYFLKNVEREFNVFKYKPNFSWLFNPSLIEKLKKVSAVDIN